MTQFYLAVLLALVAALLPLVSAIAIAIRFRRHPSPPVWTAIVLFVMAIGSAAILLWWPRLPDLASYVMIAGFVTSGLMGTAMMLRRFGGLSFGVAAVAYAVVVLPVMGWIDWRFRVVVQDRDGRPVETRDGSLDLHHPPEGYFQSYQYAHGVRLKNGTIYFGFIKWARYKDRWTFCGAFCDADNRFTGDLKWRHAGWSEWPKIVTTECPR